MEYAYQGWVVCVYFFVANCDSLLRNFHFFTLIMPTNQFFSFVDWLPQVMTCLRGFFFVENRDFLSIISMFYANESMFLFRESFCTISISTLIMAQNIIFSFVDSLMQVMTCLREPTRSSTWPWRAKWIGNRKSSLRAGEWISATDTLRMLARMCCFRTCITSFTKNRYMALYLGVKCMRIYQMWIYESACIWG